MEGCHNSAPIKHMLQTPDSEEPTEAKSQESLQQNSNGGCGGGWEMPPLEAPLPSSEEGMLLPSVKSLAYILHNCRKERNPDHALRLHAYIRSSGLIAARFLRNLLVSMLVEVGCMNDAQQVFDGLVCPDDCAWNSLIIGYVKSGELQHALILHQKMQQDSVHPSGYTFVALLKACTRLKDVEYGCKIHSLIVLRGLEKDLFVGSTLVDMYAKFGLLAKAQDVFDKLSVRDAVSWSALIAGYAKYGHGKEALNHFGQMQLQGISPNTATFVCILKACGAIGDADKGEEIHAEIARKGLMEKDFGIGNIVVDMYAKCGLLAKAQDVFDKLPVRDVVSWTALIAGYAKHGCGEEALNCFEQMQLEGVSPDIVTFVCILNACSSLGDTDNCQEIHAEIARKGLLERDVAVGNALVDMYANCGLLENAHEVLDKLPVRDVVSWTALIAGYAKCGQGEEALNSFEQMQCEGIAPNSVTFVCSLQACGSIGAADKGREIHAEIAKKELLERDLLVGNALVDMYASCGLLAKAQEVFDKLPVRDVVSWNILTTGYAKHGCGEQALSCFEQMQHERVCPNAVTYVCSLKACGSLGATEKGREIHAEIVREGLLERDLGVGNALVDMYAYCGLLAKALEVFEKLPVRDVASWTALIAAYVKHGCCEDALNSFELMKREGFSPNAVTFVCILKACGSIGATDKGQEIHVEIARKRLLESDLVVGNTLVDMYAKCGLLARAQKVFDELPARDGVTWNALIAGYAQIGESENVFQIFDRMRQEHKQPDMVTFVSVLNACSHAGLVDEGLLYFEAMSKDYGIIPNLEHLTCMVDLLSRAGQLDESVGMIQKMPCHPNLVAWHTLLGACRKWRDAELGRRAFEHAVQLDPRDAAAHVSMFNIYADADIEEDAQKVKAMRMTNKLGISQDIVGGLKSMELCNRFWLGIKDISKEKIFMQIVFFP